MPPAPAAPPPAAPAAAPAAAPKSAPAAPSAPAKPAAAPAAPSREDNEPSFMGEYAAEIDELSKGDIKPVQRQRGKPAEKPAAEVKPPGDEVKPAGDEPAAGTAAPAAEPTSVPEMRKAYTALKKKASEYEPTIQRLTARVKELETSNPADVKTLNERLAAAEKRRDELENEVQFVDYSKSKEFQEKFDKPYTQAFSKALYEVTQLNRTMEDGSTKKATQDDILALANAPLDQLDKMAEDWFPNSAARVIRHIEKIKDLSDARFDALETAKATAAERSKTSEIDRKASTEKTVKMLEDAHSAISQKWPKMFGTIEDDADGNALLEKGEAMYQKVFRPTEDNRPQSPEEAIQLHALVRNKVRNHDRLALWLKKANAQIKELETALSQYEASDPNGGLDRGRSAGNGGGIKSELASGLDELDALSKKSGV